MSVPMHFFDASIATLGSTTGVDDNDTTLVNAYSAIRDAMRRRKFHTRWLRLSAFAKRYLGQMDFELEIKRNKKGEKRTRVTWPQV